MALQLGEVGPALRQHAGAADDSSRDGPGPKTGDGDGAVIVPVANTANDLADVTLTVRWRTASSPGAAVHVRRALQRVDTDRVPFRYRTPPGRAAGTLRPLWPPPLCLPAASRVLLVWQAALRDVGPLDTRTYRLSRGCAAAAPAARDPASIPLRNHDFEPSTNASTYTRVLISAETQTPPRCSKLHLPGRRQAAAARDALLHRPGQLARDPTYSPSGCKPSRRRSTGYANRCQCKLTPDGTRRAYGRAPRSMPASSSSSTSC